MAYPWYTRHAKVQNMQQKSQTPLKNKGVRNRKHVAREGKLISAGESSQDGATVRGGGATTAEGRKRERRAFQKKIGNW